MPQVERDFLVTPLNIYVKRDTKKPIILAKKPSDWTDWTSTCSSVPRLLFSVIVTPLSFCGIVSITSSSIWARDSFSTTVSFTTFGISPASKHRPSLQPFGQSYVCSLTIACESQKNSIKIQRALVEGQVHSINEFQHLKKAMDLLTLQLFDVQNKINSSS